jgi:hypothetical protein
VASSADSRTGAGRIADPTASAERTAEIARLYFDERLTLREVGERFGITATSARLRLKRAGIPRRSPSAAGLLRQARAHAGQPTPEPPNPSGFCICGCGGKTRLARQTIPEKQWVKGTPLRYIAGHHKHKSPVHYLVDPQTGCWVWQRNRRAGYGQLNVNGRRVSAHRLYYERAKGPVPEGLELDHLCRNRACVNPDHLEPVTHLENIARAAKLRPAEVAEIRRSSESTRTLAVRYGVSERTIQTRRAQAREEEGRRAA